MVFQVTSHAIHMRDDLSHHEVFSKFVSNGVWTDLRGIYLNPAIVACGMVVNIALILRRIATICYRGPYCTLIFR